MFNPNEAKTRKELIDPALQKAGWDVNNPDQVGLEIPVDGSDPQAWAIIKTKLKRVKETGGIYDAPLPVGISDYVLYRPNGEIIAIVEAKRTSTDPRLAQAQNEPCERIFTSKINPNSRLYAVTIHITSLGEDAVERSFTTEQVQAIMHLASTLAA